MRDRTVIQCNYREPTRIAPKGARAYVQLPNPGNAHDRIQILVRSRSGRWVSKWEALRRLGDFRVRTLPPAHPLYTERLWDDPQGELCARLQAAQQLG